MKTEQILLCIINWLDAMAFALIAPIYPPWAKEKNVSVQVCGLVISMLAFSETITIILAPYWISKIGRYKLFLIGTSAQVICTFGYALWIPINNTTLFIWLSLIIRFFHGFGCGIVVVIAYSITSMINTKDEIKEATGYMELSFGAGFTLGPWLVSFFYYLGGYSLPFIGCGFINIFSIICIFYIPIESTGNPEQDESPMELINLLKNKDILIISVTGMIQINSATFFVPTLSNYLITRFNVSLEVTSLFFVITMIGYFSSLQFISGITHKFGLKLTIGIGLFLAFIGAWITAPISLWPESSFIVAVGLFVIGAQNAWVNVPMFVVLVDIMSNMNISESKAGDKASALFTLFLNLGALWSPSLGAYMTEKTSFQGSCYLTGLISLWYAMFFIYYFYTDIIKISHSFDKFNANNGAWIDKQDYIRE